MSHKQRYVLFFVCILFGLTPDRVALNSDQGQNFKSDYALANTLVTGLEIRIYQ